LQDEDLDVKKKIVLPKKMRPLTQTPEEKSSGFANKCLIFFIVLLLVITMYSKYMEEKYQRMVRFSGGENLDEVFIFNNFGGIGSL
jgi:hypothetical protein